MTNQEKKTMMATLASRWHESGKSQKQFSSENNISAHSLRYWQCKHRDLTGSGSGFVQFKGFTTTEGFLVRYPNDVELKLSAHVPVSAKKELIYL